MTWQKEWNDLSQRILALQDAGDRIFRSSNVNPNGFKPVIERLLHPQTRSVFDDLERFAGQWKSQLPEQAANALSELIEKSGEDLLDPKKTGDSAEGWRVLGARGLAALAVIRAEVAYHLSDPSLEAISITERAFQHLQWLIVSDVAVQTKWQTAFDKNEMRCEQLGATHLLHHGIWAFKADANKQKTDLVLHEPVEDTPELRRAARALVLTEWKRVTDPKNLAAAAEQGRNQARIYSGEALAGLELRSVRYVALVCKKRLPVPADVVEGNITYRHQIVAVAPDLASS